jgi:hypothetical protein
MFISISKIVQSIIDGDPSIQDAIQRGYANYSAIARMIKSNVEEQIEEPVNMQSLITAVKRCNVNYKPPTGNVSKVISESVINLRTDVAKITLEKTRVTMNLVRSVLAEYVTEFFQVLEGMSSITLIIDQKIFRKIKPLFPSKAILDEKKDLAAIIVQSPKEIIATPGCAIAFYNPISRRGVNIEETMSSYTDTIVVLKMEDVGRAFNALNDLISGMRKQS